METNHMAFSIVTEPLPLTINEDGVVYIEGTRVPLATVVGAYQSGASPEEIVEEYPSLKLADVYFALGYYLRQPEQITDYLRHQAQQAETETQRRTPNLKPRKITDRLPAARRQFRQQKLRKVASLWAGYVRIRRELREENYSRSNRPAEVELAEWLVQLALGGDPVPGRSNAGYDVVADDKRIEVKSISKTRGNPNGYIITDRDRQNDPTAGATHYAFVFFDEWIPSAIYLVPEDFVRNHPKNQIQKRDLERVQGSKVDIDLTPFAEASSKTDLKQTS